MPQTPSKQTNFLLMHPLLFVLYPLVALWSANLGQIPAFAILRSLLFSAGFLVIVLGLNKLVFREPGKATASSSLISFLFFTFGHAYQLLGGAEALRYRSLLLIWGLFLAAGLFLIIRSRRIPELLHTGLLVGAGFLVLVPSALILWNSMTHLKISAQEDPVETIVEKSSEASPDVYYILIDSYAREDQLNDMGFDNSAFIQSLTDLGFDVDPCAQGNYDNTQTSMPSTLNMEYLDALGVPIYTAPDSIEIEDLADLIKNSRVRRQFSELGYKLVTFRTVYPWLNITDSDVYLDPETTVSIFERQEAINFQYLFLRTTLMLPLMDWLDSAGSRLENFPAPVLNVFNYINPKSSFFLGREYREYRNNLFAFEKLETIPSLPGKKFVYAHIFPAHAPFVFNADGSLRAGGEEDVESYLQSLQYTNTRILAIVKKILEQSETPPIIILQGDHGFLKTPERVRIFNAFYFPGAPDLHPDGVTPVNTFRLLFSHYFGLDYPLLPDQSFDSPTDQDYIFNPVAPSCVR
ncbi:MAG: hypothetical protein JW987_15600 [Anaerolineaceae bacterium]|nr:hypothetical protein [Anaerolineaceae bacterium]